MGYLSLISYLREGTSLQSFCERTSVLRWVSENWREAIAFRKLEIKFLISGSKRAASEFDNFGVLAYAGYTPIPLYTYMDIYIILATMTFSCAFTVETISKLSPQARTWPHVYHKHVFK